jgi:DNA-binding SARP family transcriptional activator/TolB-like protein
MADSTGTPPIGPVVVRLRLIGQMEAWTLTSESLLPTGRKTRALLAMIALSAPRPVLRGKLAEMLWSRRPEEQARASLRQEIHRLMEALDPLGGQILAITRDHLALRPGAVWVDVDEVARATPSKPSALALFDGELLEGLDGVDPAFDGWLAAERERLVDRARSLAEIMLREQTEPDALITAAQQLLRIDRSHEGAWRALIRAYLARGERGMAVQAYERCRAVLSEMLDAQPSVETQRLLGEIRSIPAKMPVTDPGSAPGAGAGAGVADGAGPSHPQAQAQPLPMATPGVRTPRSHPPFRPVQRTTPRGFEEQDEPGPNAPARLDPRFELGRSEPRDPGRSPGPRGGARVGVMPLQLIGTTESEAYLSTGLADEITAALARFRWMFLVSSSSLARFATQTRDESAIRRTFGLDFLLDGVVQRAGARIRVSLRLLDLRGGNQVVWSARFDRASDDLLTLQDEVAAEVVAQIDPEILLIEAQRIAARPTADPSANDLLLRAISLLGRLERPLFMQAGELLRQSIALEPDYAAVHAWYAYWYIFYVGQGWASDIEAGMAEAGRLADRAITLDPQDAKALTIAGHVRAFLHRRLREALTLHERALTLNPNLAMAWNLSGVAYAYLGDLDEAERRIARYKKLSPLDPQAFFFDTARILVALLRQDDLAAVELGREVTSINASFSAAFKPYLAALGHLGLRDEMELVRARLMSLEPSFTVTGFLATTPLEKPEHREYFARGLTLAGVPE